MEALHEGGRRMRWERRKWAWALAGAALLGCAPAGSAINGLPGDDPTRIGVGGDLSGVDPRADSDMDGITDRVEGSGDSDGDMVPAHLDPDEQGPPTGGAPAPEPADAGSAPVPTADGGGEPVAMERKGDVQLVIHDDAKLSIGDTLPEFAYPGGMMAGTITDHGDGTATVFLPADNTSVPPLDIFGIGEVQIEPKDMTGTIDFCTGIVEMPFDATFRPVLAGLEQGEMSVVTDLTTETSPGINTPDRSLKGERLGDDDNLRLVGIADVQPTDSGTVNLVLGLPADARTDMPGHFVFEDFRPECPDAQQP